MASHQAHCCIDADAQELAAGVLADLAKEKGLAKRAIVNVGGVGPLVTLLTLGSASAQKHACCALWGLTQGETTEAAQHKRQVSGQSPQRLHSLDLILLDGVPDHPGLTPVALVHGSHS